MAGGPIGHQSSVGNIAAIAVTPGEAESEALMIFEYLKGLAEQQFPLAHAAPFLGQPHRACRHLHRRRGDKIRMVDLAFQRVMGDARVGRSRARVAHSPNAPGSMSKSARVP